MTKYGKLYNLLRESSINKFPDNEVITDAQMDSFLSYEKASLRKFKEFDTVYVFDKRGISLRDKMFFIRIKNGYRGFYEYKDAKNYYRV